MASHTPAYSVHATLAATVADDVTFDSPEPAEIEVFNRGVDPIYFTVNGPVPTVGAEDTDIVLGGQWVKVGGGLVVRLVSAGNTPFSVKRVS